MKLKIDIIDNPFCPVTRQLDPTEWRAVRVDYCDQETGAPVVYGPDIFIPFDLSLEALAQVLNKVTEE